MLGLTKAIDIDVSFSYTNAGHIRLIVDECFSIVRELKKLIQKLL